MNPVIALMAIAACAPLTDSEVFEREYELAEKREQWAIYRHFCQRAADRTWMCVGASRRKFEQAPWLYCGCAENRDLFIQ